MNTSTWFRVKYVCDLGNGATCIQHTELFSTEAKARQHILDNVQAGYTEYTYTIEKVSA